MKKNRTILTAGTCINFLDIVENKVDDVVDFGKAVHSDAQCLHGGFSIGDVAVPYLEVRDRRVSPRWRSRFFMTRAELLRHALSQALRKAHAGLQKLSC